MPGIVEAEASAVGAISVEFSRSELTEAEIRKALAQMSVRPRPEIGAASATAATKAHDHAEHDHAEGEHEPTHGGIFGANTELIFALICGGALATGFASEKLTTAPAWIPLACFLAAYVFGGRSEEHTSELQSLMRISYAVFCLKTKTNATQISINKKHIAQTIEEGS